MTKGDTRHLLCTPAVSHLRTHLLELTYANMQALTWVEYSYAVVLWFMIHGDIPLDDVPIKDMFRAADSHRALRPRLDRITFEPMKDLIKRLWNDNPRLRGSADDIVATLRSMRLPRDPNATGALRVTDVIHAPRAQAHALSSPAPIPLSHIKEYFGN